MVWLTSLNQRTCYGSLFQFRAIKTIQANFSHDITRLSVVSWTFTNRNNIQFLLLIFAFPSNIFYLFPSPTSCQKSFLILKHDPSGHVQCNFNHFNIRFHSHKISFSLAGTRKRFARFSCKKTWKTRAWGKKFIDSAHHSLTFIQFTFVILTKSYETRLWFRW